MGGGGGWRLGGALRVHRRTPCVHRRPSGFAVAFPGPPSPASSGHLPQTGNTVSPHEHPAKRDAKRDVY